MTTSGAPITVYNRISTEKLTVHSNIYEPDYVVVVDESLLESIDVTAGLKEEGAIVKVSEIMDEEAFIKDMEKHPLSISLQQNQSS